MGIFEIVIISLIGVLLLFLLLTYNNLIGKKNGVEKSLKNVDTLLLKRYDLMESLILQAERAMDHEETIHIQLAQLRQDIQSANDKKHNVVALDESLNQALSRFNILVEQYPELKGVNAVITGMDANIRLENEISASRIQYNDNVELYKNATEMFPNNILASMFGFNSSKYTYIEVDKIKKAPPIHMYTNKIKKKYEI